MSMHEIFSSHSPLEQRGQLRICQVRAVESPAGRAVASGLPLTAALDFGRLSRFLEAAGSLAPGLTGSAECPDLQVVGERSGRRSLAWRRLRIQTASGRLVDLRIMATTWSSLNDTIDLLEDLHYECLSYEPEQWAHVDLEDVPAEPSEASPFHQLVFIPESEPEPSWETIQRLVYRADLDAIEEHSSIEHPEEMNRRPGQLAAVGNFGSVMWGIQDYVESALALSAALTVSASACVQDVRLAALERLRELKTLIDRRQTDRASVEQPSNRPEILAGLRSEISWLEADLTFGAEASAVISPLLQSLRVESYHQALYNAADVLRQSQLVGRMLERLRTTVDAEARAEGLG